MLLLLLGVVAQDAPAPPSTNVRYRFIAPSVRPMNEYETDYKSWVFASGNSSSITNDGVQYTVQGNQLQGAWHRIVYARWVPHLGERLAAAGLTSASGPITLSITGLPPGEHSVKTWHNSFNNIAVAANLSIAVNDEEIISVSISFCGDINQSLRRYSYTARTFNKRSVSTTFGAQRSLTSISPSSPPRRLWKSHTHQLVATKKPISMVSSSTVLRLQLKSASPIPEIWTRESNLTGASMRHGKPPRLSRPSITSTLAPRRMSCSVYLRDRPAQKLLLKVGDPGFILTISCPGLTLTWLDLNNFDTYYWRVDVVSGGEVHVGRVWMFRLAQLAFPGAEGYG